MIVKSVVMSQAQPCGAMEIRVSRKGKRYEFTCPVCACTGRVKALAPNVTESDLTTTWPAAIGAMEHRPTTKA